ncbi:coniferyl-alcohol dehydrogenase [Mycolicibacterium iranicum]|uniref:3-alpha-hydroxysteroid dehydrogenase n=1 Tax=Mycolicibacterium iranicum TaxID=912594 RepID=A0A178LX06_MYCIR|nr:coniferyl-alcohol dehydrogenase [Mycolicibacterium iranicum]OAN38562.1 3-alpha-hydroxysteroid dehydrogenase [Mycolicibacterium iranicum]
MVQIDELFRYDGRRVIVTGCASGIGAALVRLLDGLGAEVMGLDVRSPATDLRVSEFRAIDLADEGSIADAAAAVEGPVDALFNVAGVSSGIKDPLRVVRINFLGTRRFTEAITPLMPSGSAIANVSSLAASQYLANAPVTLGLLETQSFREGIEWCHRNPEALADGGYRLSKEATILYGLRTVKVLGARGIRVNCTAPGVTDTPILDQLRSAYGQGFLDSFQNPLGRHADADEQASVLAFLNSAAARHITGHVIWVDGGSVAERVFGDLNGQRRARDAR